MNAHSPAPDPAPPPGGAGRINEDRIVYASIIALALGVMPIVALSDRLSGQGINHARLLLCSAYLASSVICFFLARSGYRRQAALVLVSVLWTGVTVFAYATGIGLHSSVMFLYIVAILYTSLLCGFIPAAAQTALTFVSLSGLYWCEVSGRIGGIQVFLQKTTIFNFYLGLVVSCIGALVIAAAYQRAVERASGEARSANDQLEQLNATLERKVAERTRELEATIDELESFNYSVSHDLRSPLRAIHGFASRLADTHGTALDAEARRQLERVAGEAQRMDVLLMALLGYGRIGRRALKIESLNLSAMVARVAEELTGTLDCARTRFLIQPELRTQADRHLLRIVLEHLLGNAVKFSRECAEPLVEFGRAGTERGDAFFVRDNGAGFDPAFASHLYKPFHRLHADGEFPGLGMGLASARRILERHGGQVWAESGRNHGATFYFTLPA